jgi:hypothetical protein
MNRSRTQAQPVGARAVSGDRRVLALVGVGALLTACGGSEAGRNVEPVATTLNTNRDVTASSAPAPESEANGSGSSQGDCPAAFRVFATLCLSGELNGAAIGPFSTDAVLDGQTLASSCADWAKGKNDAVQLGGVFSDGQTGDRVVGYGMDLLTDYTGPGVYPMGSSSQSALRFTLVLGGVSYLARSSGSGEVTIEPSGGGRIQFADWQSFDGQTATGFLAWSCSEPA